jgi:CheY-like chemotaxis protein
LLDRDLGLIEADPGQVEQAVLNLIVNAKDAMPEGGSLTIETTNVDLDREAVRERPGMIPGRYIALSVSDTGMGMSPEVAQRVFDPFFTTKERGKGTGLGLSTVYGIVKQSMGYIYVDSKPGAGTTFRIYLPRTDKPAEEIEPKVPRKEELPRGRETVLVVEDESAIRVFVAQVLRNQGYNVVEATGSGEAFLLAEKFPKEIDLLLTDVIMPAMNGPELAERLAAIHPEMKVLYMSGYPDETIARHGVLKKGVNFLQKPFTIEDLLASLRKVLDQEAGNPPGGQISLFFNSTGQGKRRTIHEDTLGGRR